MVMIQLEKDDEILNNPVYSELRQVLGKDNDSKLVQAVNASENDKIKVRIILVFSFIMPLIIAFIHPPLPTAHDLGFSYGITETYVDALISVSLFGFFLSGMPIMMGPFVGVETNKPQGITDFPYPHYYWLKFRVRYGFWLTVLFGYIFGQFMFAICMMGGFIIGPLKK